MRIPLLILAAAFPLICQAGATLGFREIEPLLKQKPQLSSFLYESFVLPDSAYAEVRLSSDFTHLSAYRLGPYSFEALPRGAKDKHPVLITLCTRSQFLDGSGKVIPDGADRMFQAVELKEELTAILVREVSARNTGSSCP